MIELISFSFDQKKKKWLILLAEENRGNEQILRMPVSFDVNCDRIELITDEASLAVNIYLLSSLHKLFWTLAFFFNSADWFSATLLEAFRYVGVLVTLSTD